MSNYNGTKRTPGDFAKRMVEIGTDVMTEAGVAADQAGIVAREIAIRLHWEWGGNRVNVQRDPAFDGLTQRDRDIWAKFTGANFDELASEFKLSWRMIRYVIAHCRNVHKNLVQPELPGLDVPEEPKP